MKYKMDTPEYERQINFRACMQFPEGIRKADGLRIQNMRMCNEKALDTEGTEDNDSEVLHPLLVDEDMGGEQDGGPIVCPEPEGSEDHSSTGLAPIMGEELQVDARPDRTSTTDGNQPKDRGNDISFDIPLISVKYT